MYIYVLSRSKIRQGLAVLWKRSTRGDECVAMARGEGSMEIDVSSNGYWRGRC